MLRLAPAFLVTVVYSLQVVHAASNNVNFKIHPEYYPRDNCLNLQYKWWHTAASIGSTSGTVSPTAYVLSMVMIIACIPSVPYSVLTQSLFLGTLFMSHTLVGERNAGSA